MAMEATISSTASARPGLHSVIVAATIGNVLEWFDSLVYGFFAVTIAAAASVFSIMATARNRDGGRACGTPIGTTLAARRRGVQLPATCRACPTQNGSRNSRRLILPTGVLGSGSSRTTTRPGFL